jgi:hypothetical protein
MFKVCPPEAEEAVFRHGAVRGSVEHFLQPMVAVKVPFHSRVTTVSCFERMPRGIQGPPKLSREGNHR